MNRISFQTNTYILFLKKNIVLCCITFILTTSFVAIQTAQAQYKILTIQHQTFDSYTDIYKGFLQGLEESDLRDEISIENYNAEKNFAALKTKILATRKISPQSNDIDLIFTIGTQATKRTLRKIKHIPVVFTGVGSPIVSGIIPNWKSAAPNVTGIGTPDQILKAVTQLHELAKFGSIGITYLKGSPSHEAVLKQIKIMSKRYGLEFIYDGFPLKKPNGDSYTQDEIQKKIKKSLDTVLPKVEAFYVQASGTYSKNFHIFKQAFKKYNVASFGDPIYIRKGIIVGVGVNNFIFGKQAADYAVKILKGTPPPDLPMDTGRVFSILVNLEAAQIVNMPALSLMPIMNSADAIYQRIQR